LSNAYEAIDHLVALQSARKRLLAAIEDLDEAGAEQVVHGEWRVRDLLTHLAAWDDLTLDFLRAVAAGTREFDVTASPQDDWAAWNAAQVGAVEAGAASTLAGRLARLEGARETLLDAVYTLDQSTLELVLLAPWGFENTVLGHVLAQAVHDSMHADQISEALARR
jgi:hypothetical protein